MMKQAMSCGCCGEGGSGLRQRARSLARRSTSDVRRRTVRALAIRGQSNFGNRAILTGSVLVSDSV